MNKALFRTLIEWPRATISGSDLHLILKTTPDARYSIVKRAVNENILIPLKRDLFLISKFDDVRWDPYEVAPLLYGPSYISFESALSYHGWIPEGVKSVTSATSKRSALFPTPLLVFSYEHIPVEAFPYAIEQHPQATFTLFMASPLKALADTIYARKKRWTCLADLYEDMRVEPESLSTLKNYPWEELIANYPSKAVKVTLNALKKELKQ